ncbi:3-deoxy-manno-octulosonate cytidylyltransferase [Pseudomarimonas salicorniae]|uniref:3-deoxy-manno-octulosonate cytidylyltransferase n=1 Tax=Pseudomarimonas salicorniae TaxID=2933270 RepID=A0ABT0GEV2_9GAMM|nr:3-deoxy-manno-octulosonate cytidylyltransferase [Lysobacter sp. CAU 1642]MCK7592963.1 3-deoxy-manno-octulosonate cytidylyltransferase [Lysobacter sp. CAU 1642]
MAEPLEFVVVIPARYASTRLPGKPLAGIAGRPMIAHVVDRARESGAMEVVVATDDERVRNAVAPLGIEVAMTSPAHASGTDRLAEVAAQRGWADSRILVNLQGDEPQAPPAAIRACAEALARTDAPIATLAVPIVDAAQLFDPNCVKLVRDAAGNALYFSRAPIPWARDAFVHDRLGLPQSGRWWRHVGLYGYRCGALAEFTRLPPGMLEQVESLEQLRALEAGWRIAVATSPVGIPAGVDTPEDLERVRAEMEGRA